jgi:hypothetical protein
MVLEDIMNDWKSFPILTRADGSYVITHDGLPYHVPAEEPMHGEVAAYAALHPGAVFPEPGEQPNDNEQQNWLQQGFEYLVRKRLNEFAQTKDYDEIVAACSYSTSTNATYAAEGQYCVDARDATWAAAIALVPDVRAGTLTPEQAIARLPALAWPDEATA